jgi:hypothetical protein
MSRREEIEIPTEGGLLTYTVSLMRTHLCQAIDLHLTASRPTGLDWRVRSHAALSSVLHGFCAFETSVNEAGYNLFFNPNSPSYVPPPSRGHLLNKAVAGWRNLACLDKYALIFDVALGEKAPVRQEGGLRELNLLRNWIAHGFVFETTVLVTPSDIDTFTEIDREDTAGWASKFPNLKFNRLDELDHTGSRKAIVTVIDGLLQTHRVLGVPLIMNSLDGGAVTSVATYPAEASIVLDDHLARRGQPGT